jgi:hypothetical protein
MPAGSHSPAHVSKAMQGLGVTKAPHRFSQRGQLLAADRSHSSLALPERGFNGQALKGRAVSSRNFNDAAVRGHMNFLGGSGSGFSRAQIGFQLQGEPDRGRYYWHHNGNFDYVHYNDHWGYSWYGWYVGDSYFWTRYYGNRWWFYDDGQDRWFYWSAGSWWWQDPNDFGTIYLYQDDSYARADFGAP